MANRKNYFYRQQVTEAELDAGFEGLEVADRDLYVDALPVGIVRGCTVVEHAPQNVSIDIAAGCIYDQAGQRIEIPSLQNLSLAVDRFAVSTAVAVGGNEKWISVWANFVRNQADARVDGNSNTVYFVQDESFEFVVEQGAEAAIGVAVRPALKSDMILICDVRRVNADTTIANADISTTRREDALVLPGVTYSMRKGTLKEAVVQMNTDYGAQTAGTDGASRIGAQARAGSPVALSAGGASAQIGALQTALNAHINETSHLHSNTLIFMGRVFNYSGFAADIIGAVPATLLFDVTTASFDVATVVTGDEFWVDVYFRKTALYGTPVITFQLGSTNFTSTSSTKVITAGAGDDCAIRLRLVATSGSTGTPSIQIRADSADVSDGIAIDEIDVYVSQYRFG